jgi:hypothetical protein
VNILYNENYEIFMKEMDLFEETDTIGFVAGDRKIILF